MTIGAYRRPAILLLLGLLQTACGSVTSLPATPGNPAYPGLTANIGEVFVDSKPASVVFHWCDLWLEMLDAKFVDVETGNVVYQVSGGLSPSGYSRFAWGQCQDLRFRPGKYRVYLLANLNRPGLERSLFGEAEFEPGKTYLAREDQCFWCGRIKSPKGTIWLEEQETGRLLLGSRILR